MFLTHATCGRAAGPMQVTVPGMRGSECAVVTTLQPRSVSRATYWPFTFSVHTIPLIGTALQRWKQKPKLRNWATASLCAIIAALELNVGHQGQKPPFNHMGYNKTNAMPQKTIQMWFPELMRYFKNGLDIRKWLNLLTSVITWIFVRKGSLSRKQMPISLFIYILCNISPDYDLLGATRSDL